MAQGNLDLYSQFVTSVPGRSSPARSASPAERLRRHEVGQPPLHGPVLVGGEGRLVEPVREMLRSDYELVGADADTSSPASSLTPPRPQAEDLKELFEFFNPVVRRVAASGRVVVLGTTPDETGSVDGASRSARSRASPAHWARR